MSHRAFPFQLNPALLLSRLFDNDAFLPPIVKPPGVVPLSALATQPESRLLIWYCVSREFTALCDSVE